MDATYVSANSFKVAGNLTSEFNTGRRVRMDCDTDGVKYAAIISSSYATGYTTVVVDESELTANLTSVLYGIIQPGAIGALPDHTHDGSEGSGGTISGTVSSGTGPHSHNDYVTWDFGANTISGTGDIYCNDIYTSSGTVYIGDLKLSTADGQTLLINNQAIEATITGTAGSTSIFVDSGAPAVDDPGEAAVGDYYFDSDTSELYEKQSVDPVTLLSDSFPGTTLDTTTNWGTPRITPNASITVSGALECNNQTGSAHSGAWVYSKTNFSKTGFLEFTCKWKPHKDHYSAGANPPMIVLRHPSSYNPSTFYGNAQSNCILIFLGQGSDSTDRTQLSILENTSTLNTQAISIDETQWHDLTVSLDCDTRVCTVDLNGVYNFNATISQAVFDAMSDNIKLEIGTADYNKNNTEYFDDVLFTRTALDVWLNLGRVSANNFLDLSDTPSTYSGTDNQYAYSTGTGIAFSSVSQWYQGDGTPDPGLGAEGDYYHDNLTDDVYRKDAGLSPTTFNGGDKAAGITLSNGDLTATMNGGNQWNAVRTYFSTSSGKWYWEVTVDVDPASAYFFAGGIGTSSETLTYPGNTTEGYGYYGNNGNKYNSSNSVYGDTYTAGDIIGVALDLDSGKIWFSKNGVWQASGNPVSGVNEAYSGVAGTFYAMIGLYANTRAVTANFGATDFVYTVPTGYNAGFGSVTAGVWSLVGSLARNFTDLDDTPDTYEDGHYLRTTASGITTVSGIILEAPNGSEWLLQVTNSGTLYTTEVT